MGNSNPIKVITDPIVETVVEPVVDTVVEPVVDTVVEPVVDTVVQPVVDAVTDAVVAPMASLVGLGSSSIGTIYSPQIIDDEWNQIQALLNQLRGQLKTVQDGLAAELKILDLDSAKDNVDRWNLQIQEVIDNLDVKEQIVEKILLKTDELSGITLKTGEYLILLDAKVADFLMLMDRIVNYKESMVDYFDQRRLTQFVSPLNQMGYTELPQLVCEDEKQFDGILTRLKQKCEVKSRENRELKRICLYPETSWQVFESEKARITQQALVAMCPLLIQGFGVIADKVKVVIPYKQKAITILENMNDDNKEEIKSVAEYDYRVTLNINYDSNNANQSRAFSVLENTTSCCSLIFQQERNIEDAVLVCRSIIYYEPSNPANTAKDLWDSIDTNINFIKDSYIKTVGVSIKYFGYFDLFKGLFGEVQTQNGSMDSLKKVLALIVEFNNMKGSFSQEVSRLEELAKKCIADSVTKGFTLGQFQNIRDNRDGANTTYKNKLEQSKGIHAKYDKQIDDLWVKIHDLEANASSNRCLLTKYNLRQFTNRSNCPGNHGLVEFNTGTLYYRCDACGKNSAFNTTMWGCRVCNYDLCASCKQ